MYATADAFETGAALLGLVLLAVVGGIAARVLYFRWQRAREDQPFTLQDLRALRDSGQISESEFRMMREALIGSVRAAQPARAKSPAQAAPSDPDEDEE